MANHYTVLIDRVSMRVILLDNFKVRYNRMRKRVADWVKLLESFPDIQFVMITLTYAPAYDWQPNHIRKFILAYRKVLGENLLGYAWVAELQKRGAVHYHVMLVVPNTFSVGDDLPYPDQSGLWSYGFTRVEIPLSHQTGQIDQNAVSVGEHRVTLARRNIKEWLDQVGLPYHSPHKFRHGHVHFGLANSKSVADYKAVSMNVMHSNMKITDQFYSVQNDDEVTNRISSLNADNPSNNSNDELVRKFKKFLEWEKKISK